MELGEKTIDGKKYQVGYWDVVTSTKTLTRLFKLLGEPLAKVLLGALENKEEGSSLMDVDISAAQGQIMADAIAGLSDRIDEDEVQKLIHQCMSGGILCDGKKFDWNSHFLGKIGHLMKVCLFVLRHQYSDFLGASLGEK